MSLKSSFRAAVEEWFSAPPPLGYRVVTLSTDVLTAEFQGCVVDAAEPVFGAVDDTGLGGAVTVAPGEAFVQADTEEAARLMAERILARLHERIDAGLDYSAQMETDEGSYRVVPDAGRYLVTVGVTFRCRAAAGG